MRRKLLIIQVAAMGYDFITQQGPPRMGPLSLNSMTPLFPGLTCSVQATLRTATLPAEHGIVANGLYHRALRKVLFWEQSSALAHGPRIWDTFRKKGGTVALLFWQQSLGEQVDMLLSPAPIHKHHGGMIQDCYAKPESLYADLSGVLKKSFPLFRYWGPLANPTASDWIAQATEQLLICPTWSPDLCVTYLPALDYDLQRYGPADARSSAAFHALKTQAERLMSVAQEQGYELLVFGDYAITATPHGAIFPNQLLAQAGLMKTRTVQNKRYPDWHNSTAFAMTDHEIAHVYVANSPHRDRTIEALENAKGIARVIRSEDFPEWGMNHSNSGELILVAEPGYWFAYPWWTEDAQAPDYARHVDIHNKPGYDPCELFWGWPPGSISRNTSRVCGSHGSAGPQQHIAWGTTLPVDATADFLTLAQQIRVWLDEGP